jgi:pimeloyl-ACP methyl ester carboxylesterase
MEKVQVGDILMCYRTMGEGHPLVLIMGLTATMDWWDPEFLDELSSRFRLLIFDNRGAGRSEAPPGDLYIKQFAEDTVGLMEAVGFDSAHVLGISMGGMIAQELALDHPDKVEKLVLCATFCGGQEAVYADKEVLMKLIDRSGTEEERVRKTISLLFPEGWLEKNPEYFHDFLDRYNQAPTTDENAARQFMATVRFSTFDRLPQIDKPTLVACGTEDIVIPAANSEILAERIPGARLVEFDGAGHGFINQCREEFTPVLLDFLE